MVAETVADVPLSEEEARVREKRERRLVERRVSKILGVRVEFRSGEEIGGEHNAIDRDICCLLSLSLVGGF